MLREPVSGNRPLSDRIWCTEERASGWLRWGSRSSGTIADPQISSSTRMSGAALHRRGRRRMPTRRSFHRRRRLAGHDLRKNTRARVRSDSDSTAGALVLALLRASLEGFVPIFGFDISRFNLLLQWFSYRALRSHFPDNHNVGITNLSTSNMRIYYQNPSCERACLENWIHEFNSLWEMHFFASLTLIYPFDTMEKYM